MKELIKLNMDQRYLFNDHVKLLDADAIDMPMNAISSLLPNNFNILIGIQFLRLN